MLLTPNEVADYFKTNTKLLAQWRYRGMGPEFVKIGGLVRYPLKSVEKYLTERGQQK